MCLCVRVRTYLSLTSLLKLHLNFQGLMNKVRKVLQKLVKVKSIFSIFQLLYSLIRTIQLFINIFIINKEYIYVHMKHQVSQSFYKVIHITIISNKNHISFLLPLLQKRQLRILQVCCFSRLNVVTVHNKA